MKLFACPSDARVPRRSASFILTAAITAIGWSCGSAPTAPTPRAPRTAIESAVRPQMDVPAGVVTWGRFTTTRPALQSAAPGGSQLVVTGPAFGPVPGAPRDLTQSVTGNTVTLTWLPPTGAEPLTSYIIEAGTGPGSNNLAIFDTGNDRTTLTVSGVAAGAYFVRIRGSNANGQGATSNEVVVVVGAGPGPCAGAPGAPIGLSVSVSGSTLTLTWSAPTSGCPPTTYRIEAGSTPGAADVGTILTGNTDTSYTVSFVPAGTYYLRVRAGTTSIGPASNEVTVTIGASGSYAGPFSGQVTITVSSSGGPNPTPVVCTYTYALTGTITVALQQRPDGIGSGSVQGTRTLIGTTGGSRCSPNGPGAEVLNFHDQPVTGTPSDLRLSKQMVDTSTSWRVATTSFAFAGSLSGGVISGTMTYAHDGRGTNPVGPTTVTESGSATLPVTLR